VIPVLSRRTPPTGVARAGSRASRHTHICVSLCVCLYVCVCVCTAPSPSDRVLPVLARRTLPTGVTRAGSPARTSCRAATAPRGAWSRARNGLWERDTDGRREIAASVESSLKLLGEGLRGRARCVAPRASADVASAAWSGRAG